MFKEGGGDGLAFEAVDLESGFSREETKDSVPELLTAVPKHAVSGWVVPSKFSSALELLPELLCSDGTERQHEKKTKLSHYLQTLK